MGQTLTIKTTLNSNIDLQKFEKALDEYKNSHIMLGSLDGTLSNYLYVTLKDVACKHNDLYFENGNLVGDVYVLDTPNGKLIQSLLDNGFNFDLKPRMTKDIDGNYNIISIDLTRKI